MKKHLFSLFLSIAIGFYACSEQETILFQGIHEIYFQKFYVNEVYPGTAEADSTELSFFFYPSGTQEIYAGLTVNLSGMLLTSDIQFGLKVVPGETTANPDEYDLDDSYTFHANTTGENATEILDTIRVKLLRSDRLDELPDGVRLVVELVPTDKVLLGQLERRRAKIIIKAAAVKPDWWTQEVEINLLGTYSQKKYKLFLDHADKKLEMSADLIKDHPDRAIRLAMLFKQWLNEQNPAITEDNGTLMSVPL
ncbi:MULTISPECIES: DUF4843 domain-containing protein [Sanguibacteroides]|uniref:Uncharacterized protein n=1 Tax=Sanguibacteroides justesenii TaxID=1547597 RepID=A0A0C3NDN5_9PORP|nr:MULTISPECIES: DUF4843 domain-containing protein [Sanguibacteroides]KIO44217.1 hypothetical protein BA92_12695 [Sanguibacteroides justesenii]KIO47118.1 hypothetical protein IE90_00480 [Sanguibacteroides justesenii]PXZ42654.1 DUF4843 domain-containing protein [Sanguibacteroides justesenii]